MEQRRKKGRERRAETGLNSLHSLILFAVRTLSYAVYRKRHQDRICRDCVSHTVGMNEADEERGRRKKGRLFSSSFLLFSSEFAFVKGLAFMWNQRGLCSFRPRLCKRGLTARCGEKARPMCAAMPSRTRAREHRRDAREHHHHGLLIKAYVHNVCPDPPPLASAWWW